MIQPYRLPPLSLASDFVFGYGNEASLHDGIHHRRHTCLHLLHRLARRPLPQERRFITAAFASRNQRRSFALSVVSYAIGSGAGFKPRRICCVKPGQIAGRQSLASAARILS